MYNAYKFLVKKPFFSFVVPTYNRASDLKFALYCIFRQSFSDYEIVISDNCSTDNTENIINKLKNKKIRYFRNRKNIGMILNQKKAIECAKGEYVFLHGDDDFLLYDNSLEEIHKQIIKHSPGYVRLNYTSLAFDGKHIFSYKVNKPFEKNYYLLPYAKNEEVLSFIVDSDNYFFSGIIFKNDLPKSVVTINADPSPWIDILFYTAKNYGAYFINRRHLIASWSRRTKKNEDHGFYELIEGKLKAENYFEVVKEKIDGKAYQRFLHKELMTIYVNLFPAIKVNVGNKKMLQISERIRFLDQTMVKSIMYWAYFIPIIILPRGFLKIVKDIYLYLYIRFSKVNDDTEIIKRLKALESGYLKSSENVFKRKESLFNF